MSPSRYGNSHTSSRRETTSATVNSGMKTHTPIKTPGKDMFWKANCGSESKDEYLLIYYSMASLFILL